MRAVVVPAYGGPEMLCVQDVPEPQPGPGEVSVAVRFAGVNYTDVRNRQGDGLGKPPFIPGVEVAGPAWVRYRGPRATPGRPGTRCGTGSARSLATQVSASAPASRPVVKGGRT